MTDQETAASSYILTFYNEIMLLNSNYSLFLNHYTLMAVKYNKAEDVSITDQERDYTLNLIHTIKTNIIKINLQYNAITKDKKDSNNTAINKQYDIILNAAYNVVPGQIHTYVQYCNNFIVSKLMQTLLSSSKDIVAKLYHNATA